MLLQLNHPTRIRCWTQPVLVYDRNQNSALEVNPTNYESCILDHLIHSWTTGAGRDVVPLMLKKYHLLRLHLLQPTKMDLHLFLADCYKYCTCFNSGVIKENRASI